MRAFTLLIAASTAVAFTPPQRLSPATQMTTPAAPAPVAAARTSTALAAARKKTEDMTEEEIFRILLGQQAGQCLQPVSQHEVIHQLPWWHPEKDERSPREEQS